MLGVDAPSGAVDYFSTAFDGSIFQGSSFGFNTPAHPETVIPQNDPSALWSSDASAMTGERQSMNGSDWYSVINSSAQDWYSILTAPRSSAATVTATRNGVTVSPGGTILVLGILAIFLLRK